MPKRALIERRPWLAGSIVSAAAWGILQGGETPGVYLLALHGGALALLAAYAILRHRGRDTQLLAAMLGLQAISVILFDLASPWAMTFLFFSYMVGLSLFLTHRLLSPDISHRIGAAALTLGTPALCFFIAWRAGIAIPVFYGLALGGMAAAAWISTFPQGRVGVGGVLLVAGNTIGLSALVDAGGRGELADWRAVLSWALFYLGNLALATGVTGELRNRSEFAAADFEFED